MLFHERLDFHVVVKLHAGFQNDPTSSYLRAPSCFSGEGGEVEEKKGCGDIQGSASPIRTSELKRSLLNTTQEANLKKS